MTRGKSLVCLIKRTQRLHNCYCWRHHPLPPSPLPPLPTLPVLQQSYQIKWESNLIRMTHCFNHEELLHLDRAGPWVEWEWEWGWQRCSVGQRGNNSLNSAANLNHAVDTIIFFVSLPLLDWTFNWWNDWRSGRGRYTLPLLGDKFHSSHFIFCRRFSDVSAVGWPLC